MLRRRTFLELSRDWRARTLIPVVLINVLAFVGLYRLMRHFSLENLINTQKLAAAMLLDEIELGFQDRIHDARALEPRLQRQLEAHGVLTLASYDAGANPTVETGRPVTTAEKSQVQIVLLQPSHPTMWLSEGEERVLYGVRALRNTDSCRTCHAGTTAPLGAIQVGIDLTRPMADATTRIHRSFALAGAAWIALLGLMFWTGGVVIGRPLRTIENTLSETAKATGRGRNDLADLASRMDSTIKGLIRAQRQRDDDIARQMVRAEQLAALGQLAAGLTHEIKNPLAGVIAAVELVRDEEKANREVCDQILAELRRVIATVEGLLRLARPQPPHRTDVDLGRVAREVTSLFAARLRKQGVRLDTRVALAVPSLQLDSALMVQLLMNLLTNAMQATERGGIIRVDVEPFPRNDGVVVTVSDNGCGISPEHREKIFDPFFTTKEEGTGLGLPICRQIVEQHGGTMQIESEPGSGTTVMLLLPDPNAAEEALAYGVAAAG